MKIKKYEVTDMKDALRQIKQDLGPDAVLLTTRKIMKPSGLGLFPRPVLEVTAAVEYDKDAQAETPVTPAPSTPSNRTSVPRPPVAPEDPALYSRTVTPPHSEYPYDDTDDDTYLRSLLEINRDDSVATTAASDIEDETASEETAESLLPANEDDVYVPPAKKTPPSELIKEFSGLTATQLTELLSSLGLNKISTLVDDIGEIKKQLNAMKTTLSEPTNLGVDLPPNLKSYYSLLLKNGLDELLCYRFLKNIERKLPETAGQAQLRSIVLRELAEQLPIEQDFASAMYRKVTAFIGPTGVGKTTTLAKVAATLVLKYSQRICLITADNFRIAAVEQLKTYADIVNLPLFVTTSPEELKHLLDDIRKDYDYILLDTTGRSPYDNSKLNDVAACLSVSPDIVPVVVMSMAGNHAELGDMFERYMGLEPAYVVFTKLDETRFYGPLANIPIKKKVPLLLLSTGQGVPDDLEVPDGKKIAKKLLQEIPELWKEN